MGFLNEYEQKVLVHLLWKEEATVKELVRELGMNPATLIRTVNSLISKGLAREIREKHFPFRRFLSLTEKGRKLASKLKEAYLSIS